MMIDSVTIKIPENLITIGDTFYFNQKITSGELEYINIEKTFNQKFIKEERDKGIYIPQYHLEHNKYGGKDEKFLVLQISLPKFLYGSSFYVLHSYDWPEVRDRIILFLRKIGVESTEYSIAHSIVTSISFAKNIDLRCWCSPKHAIKILSSFNYFPRSDCNFNLREKKTGGTILKYYNYLSALTIYDKMPEIVANAKTTEELTIKERYLKNEVDFKILRIEATLQRKKAVIQKAQQFFKTKKTEFTFNELFNYHFCKYVLKNEVKKVLEHPLKNIVLLSLFDIPIVRAEVNKISKSHHTRVELLEAINRIGAIGTAGYRAELLKDCSERTWFRRQKQLKELSKNLNIPIDNDIGKPSSELIDYIIKNFD